MEKTFCFSSPKFGGKIPKFQTKIQANCDEDLFFFLSSHGFSFRYTKQAVRGNVACTTRATERGGQGGTITPGPIRKAVGFSGPMSSRGAHRNDTEKSACETFFCLFWRSLIFDRNNRENFGEDQTGKTVRISAKTFFFGDHIVSASPIAKRATLLFHLIYILVSHCFGFCDCCKVILANHLFC